MVVSQNRMAASIASVFHQYQIHIVVFGHIAKEVGGVILDGLEALRVDLDSKVVLGGSEAVGVVIQSFCT